MWLPSPLPRTFAACVRDIESAKTDVRVSAAGDLVRHGRAEATRDEAVALLIKALDDTAATVRAAAAVALADLEAAQAVDALLRRVEDDDDHVRQMALLALGEVRDRKALPRVERALRDRRPEMRYQAVIAYVRLVEPHDGPRPGETPEVVAKALLAATNDEDFNVRYIALRLAEEHAADPPPARLVTRAAVLLEDDAPDVAVAAAIFLARCGDERGHPLVLDIVESRVPAQPEDEREAVELAGRLGLREAIPALRRRAFGLARHVRATASFHAVIALARMGDERAVRRITRGLASSDKKKREAAVVAAGRAGLAVARERIERLGEDEVSPALREAALRDLGAAREG